MVAALCCWDVSALSPDTAAQESDTEPPWNLFSNDQQALLGQELSVWVNTRTEPFDDDRIRPLINKVADRLAQANPVLLPLEVTTLRSSEAYALVLPADTVYLTSRLLEQTYCAQDLAGLLAHELAHLELRQLTRRISHADRFRVQAALVAAERDETSLMDALQAVGIDPHPGSPLFRYTDEEEAEAQDVAAAHLQRAGYPAYAAAAFMQRLRNTDNANAPRYLAQHPAVLGIESEAADHSSSPPCRPERSFGRLTEQAQRVSATAPALDQLLDWTPPPEPVKVARTRERLINRSYTFDYPGTWDSANPGPNEKIEVAPKGGWWQPGKQTRELVLGLAAGTLEPYKDDLVGDATLQQHLATLRPGLAAANSRSTPSSTAPLVYEQYLSGISPSGSPEQIWLLSRRLPDRVFYMLLVAPADRFEEYQAEFQAIAASIEFSGQPVPGQPSDPSHHGNHP